VNARVPVKTFLRVAEVWVPSADGSLLELAGGLFDAAPSLGALSRSMCFGRAEGLPGRAWDEGRPVMLRRLEGSVFRRTQAARAAGLTCAVALPTFMGDELTSVVVLLCGDDDDEGDIGAIELWHNDPRLTSDLTLAEGYFGATAPELEALTRDGSLPRGAGVPGLAWQREAAVFIDNVATSPQFLRAQTAAHAGIVRALALPCSVRVQQTWVLSLLSSATRPIARRIESWLPNDAGTHLQRAFGHCEVRGRIAADGPGPDGTASPIDAAWRSGAAQVAGRDGVRRLHEGDVAVASFAGMLAIPVLSDATVTEVVALYL
jgi:hypothetical protein